MNFQPTRFNILPEVIKNLLIINGLFFVGSLVMQSTFGMDLNRILGLYVPGSEHFRPLQLITHMFMHGNIGHIFFNMFALWMFGNMLENVWGGRRFLIYYMATGLGAALIHLGWNYFELMQVTQSVSAEQVQRVIQEGSSILMRGQNYSDPALAKLNLIYNIPTVGASGAVFGILLAFGMLFPNTRIYLYFAFPIKAKYFVIGYGLLELFNGIANDPSSNVAHFAHLGGMLFGFILIKYWQRKNGHRY
ncbi:MAG: rhomboid family intramembrane serine protease [Flavobacteriales bacterium]|nr:rhomboid family intramembrane serine protease [Flavobacteriales bacterium]